MSEATDVIATGAEVGYSHFNKKSDELLWKKMRENILNIFEIVLQKANIKVFSLAHVLGNII